MVVNLIRPDVVKATGFSTKEQYQIILSTGINQYPDHFKKYVFATLTDENRLLKQNK
jgi:hypothetical protein